MSDTPLELGPIEPGEHQEWRPGWADLYSERSRRDYLGQFERALPTLSMAQLDELTDRVARNRREHYSIPNDTLLALIEIAREAMTDPEQHAGGE